MTRYAMAVDLDRCTGCQTCTAACKHANATAAGVQWRRVLDFESGEYPDVRRTFVPVGCMHCRDAPCVKVCPTTATRQRPDGIVAIDYDLCIGCSYCVMSCPYQAREMLRSEPHAYPPAAMDHERRRASPGRLGVAQKCTFCSDRIDAGLARDRVPGRDPGATPACVNACISNALIFGDLDDPAGRLAGLLESRQYFRMHEALGTEPMLFYLWDHKR